MPVYLMPAQVRISEDRMEGHLHRVSRVQGFEDNTAKNIAGGEMVYKSTYGNFTWDVYRAYTMLQGDAR
jgi:hypothetical protein